MRSGRRNAIPINALFQDQMAGRNADRIAEARHRLAVGDLLLWNGRLKFWFPAEGLDRGNPTSLPLRLLKRICAEFTCRDLLRYRGVVATRLAAPASVAEPERSAPVRGR